MEISYDTEMQFARKFYKKACEGLEANEIPPPPDLWVQHSQELRSGWEAKKVELIGLLEHEDTSDEDKKAIETFLQCATAIYLDLMGTISVKFIESGEVEPEIITKPEWEDGVWQVEYSEEGSEAYEDSEEDLEEESSESSEWESIELSRGENGSTISEE